MSREKKHTRRQCRIFEDARNAPLHQRRELPFWVEFAAAAQVRPGHQLAGRQRSQPGLRLGRHSEASRQNRKSKAKSGGGGEFQSAIRRLKRREAFPTSLIPLTRLDVWSGKALGVIRSDPTPQPSKSKGGQSRKRRVHQGTRCPDLAIQG